MSDKTMYKKLYKVNKNGSTQVWEIHHNENSYWSVSGKLNGKMIVAQPTFVEPKQKRSLQEQIVFICESQINKKKDKKYVENVADIHKADDDLVGYSAMLAYKYEDHKSKLDYPIAVQRKYDGCRMLATKDGQFSRGRKAYTSCMHVQKELEQFFKAHPEARLDGEYYSEGKDNFEEIVSAVKKSAEKATAKHIELQKAVKYYVYDSPRINGLTEKDSFKDRYEALAKELQGYDNIVVVETFFDVKNEEEFVKLKEQFIIEGYEGAMARQTHGKYEGNRSHGLLKLKDFEDSEFEIIGVEEGKGNLAGCAGSFIVRNEDGSTFNAKLDGSVDRIRYLFTHQEEVVGKMATVRFQGRTNANIPRFPVMKSIRGLKDRSDWI